MPLDLDCPKCRHVFPVAEARHPVGVECPGCAAELTAEFRRLPLPTPGQPHYELLVSVGRPPGSAPPPPAARPLKLDDDEGGRRKGGSMAVVVFAGLGALAVTLAGLGAVGYFLFTNMGRPETTSARPGGDAGGDKKDPTPPPKKKTAPKPGEYVSDEWGFVAKFPAEPKVRREQAGGGSFTMFLTDNKDGACMVMAADVPGVGDNEPAAQTQTRLLGAQNGSISGVGGKLKDEKVIKLAGTQYPGREFSAAITKPATGLMRGRVYMVGKRMYTVVVQGTTAYANGPEAKALFDSFRLTD
ncbi:MAG: hypothetical protein C0501_17830 [Isosphaera sp.]|nr:hypothetical protein [Isosphaera sp.]